MHCRSVLLVAKEVQELQDNPLWGITLYQLPEHPLVCFATISGLKESLWENAVFHVTFHFSEHYNEEAPEVVFNTIPFHPNVNPDSGKMMAEFLTKDQKSDVEQEINLANLLINIQELLSNPVLDNVINVEAKQLLEESPQQYEAMVHQCVNESRRLHKIFNENLLEHYQSSIDQSRQRSPLKVIKQPTDDSGLSAPTIKPKQVSFDVYHRNWIEVATTKPFATGVSTDDDDDHVTLQMWHPNYSSLRSLSPSSSVRLTPHSSRPGVAALPSKLDQIRKKKMEKIEALKQLYLNKPENKPGSRLALGASSPSGLVPKNSEMDTRGSSSAAAWEAETDELLAWTNTLNTEQMMAS